MERRHALRPKANTRETLQRALKSWQRLRSAWGVILDSAKAVKNYERMALAESKLDDCKFEIARIERKLESAAAS